MKEEMPKGRRGNGEGNKGSDGLFRVRLTLYCLDGTTKRKSFAAKTKKEAQFKRESYIRENGRMAKLKGMTVLEAMNNWEFSAWPALKPATVRSYRMLKDAFVRTFGDEEISEIQTPEVFAWLKKIGDTHRRTAMNYKAQLSVFFNHTRTIGVITENTIAGLRLKLPKTDSVTRIHNSEQLKAILDRVSSDENRLFFAFLADSALRPWKEAVHLRAGDVGIKQDVYYVRVRDSKTEAGKDRVVPISDEIGRQLIDRQGLLFTSAEGQMMNQSKVSKTWREACQKLGLNPAPQPYSLRRYAITRWCEMGVSMDVAKVWAGHSDIRLIIDVYSQVAKSRQLHGFEEISQRHSKGTVEKQITALGEWI
jgi:integrase